VTTAAPPTLEVHRDVPEDGPPVVRVVGAMTLDQGDALWERLSAAALLAQPEPALVLDLSGVTAAAGGAAALLVSVVRAAEARGTKVEVRGAAGEVAAVVELHRARAAACPSLRPPPDAESVVEQVGRATLFVVAELKEILGFLGAVVNSVLAALRRPASVPWNDLWRVVERTGADGVPIVALLMFLVGLILGFQSAVQLSRFGADIYVADAVALSITTELGPLMTAIIVAGRSGAAFAAELGTMKVSEEVDAIRTLGLCPYRYLVLPRVLGLTIAMPLLAALADIVAIGGGLFVGVVGLDQTVSGYMTETKLALGLWDVGKGLLKSVVFGVTVSMISCDRGLATGGGAEGVGRSTTAAVVACLFALVLLDAVFTVTFTYLGL